MNTNIKSIELLITLISPMIYFPYNLFYLVIFLGFTTARIGICFKMETVAFIRIEKAHEGHQHD